jgi:ComF family protein
MPGFRTLSLLVRPALALARDLVWPPWCLACGAAIEREAALLCLPCRETIWPVGDRVCQRCGLPLPHVEEACGPCAAWPPAYARARQALVWGEAVREAILRLKRPDAPAVDAARLVRLALREAADPPWHVRPDMVVPVPLHPLRARARGFNQAALLAGALARQAGLLRVAHVLSCVRLVPEQKRLDRLARERNLREAFQVPRPDRVGGRSVLLVDDVMTTGATARACSAALVEAGAARVEVWTVARVPRT